MEFDGLPFLENIKNMAKEYNAVLNPQNAAPNKNDCPDGYYKMRQKVYGNHSAAYIIIPKDGDGGVDFNDGTDRENGLNQTELQNPNAGQALENNQNRQNNADQAESRNLNVGQNLENNQNDRNKTDNQSQKNNRNNPNPFGKILPDGEFQGSFDGSENIGSENGADGFKPNAAGKNGKNSSKPDFQNNNGKNGSESEFPNDGEKIDFEPGFPENGYDAERSIVDFENQYDLSYLFPDAGDFGRRENDTEDDALYEEQNYYPGEKGGANQDNNNAYIDRNAQNGGINQDNNNAYIDRNAQNDGANQSDNNLYIDLNIQNGGVNRSVPSGGYNDPSGLNNVFTDQNAAQGQQNNRILYNNTSKNSLPPPKNGGVNDIQESPGRFNRNGNPNANNIQEHANRLFRYPEKRSGEKNESSNRNSSRNINQNPNQNQNSNQNSNQNQNINRNGGEKEAQNYRNLLFFTNTLKNVRIILHDQAALLTYMSSLPPDGKLRGQIASLLALKEINLKETDNLFDRLSPEKTRVKRPSITRGTYVGAYNMLASLQKTLDQNFDYLINNEINESYLNGLSELIASENKCRSILRELRR
ncbi:MAG: hypothetical protein LBP62_02160 [Clostridiales bacterium]|jgi:hypothetical protein|nr:hypothetical protein [Clostridiales bacterium]